MNPKYVKILYFLLIRKNEVEFQVDIKFSWTKLIFFVIFHFLVYRIRIMLIRNKKKSLKKFIPGLNTTLLKKKTYFWVFLVEDKN